MSLFDRFTNPVWHLASTLDKDRQRIAALLITGYGACRKTIDESLVAPIESNKILPMPNTLSPEIKVRLIDEALIGLLKSCFVPKSDPGGKVPDRIVASLADVWGLFALADRNYRMKCAQPETLKDSAYSTDPEEARTQVLAKWAEMLGISQPNFVMDANRRWFYKEWGELSAAMIPGFLKGFARTPDEVILKKARSEAANIPEHRIPKARYMVETLARAPLPQPEGGPPLANRHSDVPQRPIPTPSRVQDDAPQKRLHGVEEQRDGRATINLAPNAGPLDFIRAMVVVMQPHLVARDAEVCKRWASSVTGVNVVQNQWSPAHVDALVRGFERFFWDGNGSEQWLTKLVREEYPEVKGTRIDVTLTDEIRSIFRAWTTKR